MAPRRRIDDSILTGAALDEFTSRSYEDASINTIIQNAGISKGSFYYRFKTKYALYLHLLEAGVSKKWEYIRARLSEQRSQAEITVPSAQPGAFEDIFDEFLHQARIGAEFAATHPKYHRLSVMFSREKGTKVYNDAVRDLGQHDAPGLEGRIQSAVASGQIRKEFSEQFVIKVMTHLITSFDEVLFQDREWDLEKASEDLAHYVEFLRHGLAPRDHD